MAVDHALGLACGAARVTHRRRLAFIGDPEARWGRSGEQLLVVDDAGIVGNFRSCVATARVVHDDHMAHGRHLVHQRPQDRQQRTVGEDHFVFGVVGDVGDLFGEQPDVQRVQHPARARRSEVQLEVTVGVPCERRHSARGGDAEVVECAAEAPGPLCPAPVVGALDAGSGCGHDLLVREQRLGAFNERVQGERLVHHRRVHDAAG